MRGATWSRRRPCLLLPLACIVTVAAAPSHAANLLNNPSFAAGLTDWTESGSAVPADGARTAGAGAASLTVSATAAGGTAVGLEQCVEVLPMTSYVYGTSYQLPDTQTADGSARIRVGVALFASTDCSGLFQGSALQGKTIAPEAMLSTSWYQADGPHDADAVTTGPDTHSALFFIEVEKTDTNANAYEAGFTNTYLLEGTVPVELERFTVE